MTVLVFPKWFLKSKTILLNVLSLVILVAPATIDYLNGLALVPELSPIAGIILGIVNVLNIILRFRTFIPVALTRDANAKMVPASKTKQL